MKICSKCKIEKETNQFNKKTRNKDGYDNWCKECCIIYYNKYRKENRIKLKNQYKNWSTKNSEKIQINNVEYYRENKEVIIQNSIEYQKTDKGKKVKTKANEKYRLSNKAKLTRKKWVIENKEKLNKQKRKRYEKNKINHTISGSIRLSLNGNKNSRHWEDLVEYTLQELKNHLEKLFKPEMSWDNYGKWHIDHKKPICVFNITDYNCDDFKECWSLSNLQPLWADENLKKGSTWQE